MNFLDPVQTTIDPYLCDPFERSLLIWYKGFLLGQENIISMDETLKVVTKVIVMIP